MIGPVLVVEDDADTREMIAQYFESLGFSALRAANGKEALDLVRTTPDAPCVVILDLIMPEMDGVEFLRRRCLEPRLAQTPIVVITAWAGKIAWDEVRKHTDDILKKPLSPENLELLVRRYCLAPSGSHH